MPMTFRSRQQLTSAWAMLVGKKVFVRMPLPSSKRIKMSGVKLIVTSDGSHSLLNEALNETYHSVHGAIQESQHVFINNGLNYFLASWPSESVSIFEVGFGTALNVLLTVKAMQNKEVAINYTSIEAFPIGEGLWSVLNYT